MAQKIRGNSKGTAGYANEPYAPADKIADRPIIQNASLGNDMPTIVPKPQPHQFAKPPIGGSHGYGHGVHQRKGHTRISGSPKAHHIGKR